MTEGGYTPPQEATAEFETELGDDSASIEKAVPEESNPPGDAVAQTAGDNQIEGATAVPTSLNQDQDDSAAKIENKSVKQASKSPEDLQASKDQKLADVQEKARQEILGILLREGTLSPAQINEYLQYKIPLDTLKKIVPGSVQDEIDQITAEVSQATEDIETSFAEQAEALAASVTPEATPESAPVPLTKEEIKNLMLGDEGKVYQVLKGVWEPKIRAKILAEFDMEAATKFQSEGGGDWGQFQAQYLESQKQAIESRVQAELTKSVREQLDKVRNGEVTVGEFLKDLPDWDVNKSKMQKAIDAVVGATVEGINTNWENSSFNDFMDAFFGRGDAGYRGGLGNFKKESQKEEAIGLSEFKPLLTDPENTKRFAKAFEEAYSAKGARLKDAGFVPVGAEDLFAQAKAGNREALGTLTQELIKFIFEARSEEEAAQRWDVVRIELGDKLFPTRGQALAMDVYEYFKELKKPSNFEDVFPQKKSPE